MSAGLPRELREPFSRRHGTRPVGVEVRVYVNASELFNSVGATIDREKSRLVPSDAKKILKKVRKWHFDQLKAAGDSVSYSDSSIEGICKVLLSIWSIFLRESSAGSVRKRKQKGKRAHGVDFLKACTGVIVDFCGNSETASSWRHPLIYIQSACSFAGFSAAEFLSENSLGELFGVIRNGLLQGIQKALERGQVDDVSMMWGSVNVYQSLRGNLQDQMSDFFDKTGSALPPISQEWCVRTLSIPVSKVQIEYANPAESPEVRQAASLLLFLWDHVKEGDVAREAFERFNALCERHFQLFLRGEVGATLPYDPRFHETSSAAPGAVVLVRPWVEWFSPPRSRVVLRGVVEPVVN